MERSAWDKHTSLLATLINYCCKMFIKLGGSMLKTMEVIHESLQ